MRILKTILPFLISVGLLSCRWDTSKDKESSNSNSKKFKLSVKAYMEKDSVFRGENMPFHVEVKNESPDTLIILQPTRLTFLPAPGWEKAGIEGFTYDGPERTNLYPNQSTDCGYSGLSGFKEMPLGKSVLKFQLQLYLANKKDTVKLTDSLAIHVFPSRLSMHARLVESTKSHNKDISISIKNISSKNITIGDDPQIAFTSIPSGWKQNELIISDYYGPGIAMLDPNDSLCRKYSLKQYFQEMSKGKSMLKFRVGVGIEKTKSQVIFEDSLMVDLPQDAKQAPSYSMP